MVVSRLNLYIVKIRFSPEFGGQAKSLQCKNGVRVLARSFRGDRGHAIAYDLEHPFDISGLRRRTRTAGLTSLKTRHDEAQLLRRTDPIAMKAVRHPVAQVAPAPPGPAWTSPALNTARSLRFSRARHTTASSQPSPSAASLPRSTNTGSEMVSPEGSRYWPDAFPCRRHGRCLRARRTSAGRDWRRRTSRACWRCRRGDRRCAEIRR